MTIEFHCPHCDKLLRTADDKAGVRANCPGCGESVTVPEAAESAAIFDQSFDSRSGSPEADPDSSRVANQNRGSARAAPVGPANCPMCGEEVAAGAIRCPYCGEEVKPARQRRGGSAPHRGTLILIFGILGWVVCFPFGIAAWVMANVDLREMNEGRMDDEGRGLTVAGKILGIVQCCLLGLALVFYAVVVGLFFLAQA